ncbi:Crp/Fnr family transcriptional regulator [Pedobacter sp. MC2016-15]|uniref:Crp/Fnr family transcriptional regulator n=1 Tax=Pedobacter sp. MC2016-15 TaxID=2994473 RepID=UPI00224786BF|nr:Crp/Fnr family transcriptional regulator [Pedobacter sp. MC2016-15]MCX2477658.1 Crp/Fnr family transcriptional regulator [Pedobacter sp. MC2016-15]
MLSSYLLAHQFKTLSYKKGAVVYEPGQNPRYVYFIKSGEIRMVTVNKEGKEFLQGIFKAKQYFGEPALLLQRPYLAYTIASADTELILVDHAQFLQILEEDRAFSMNLIETLSNRLFYKSMMLEELGNEQAEHRLKTLVNYLGRDLEKGAELGVTRQALADMSGLRVETVIRTIKKMSAAGEVNLSRGKLIK